MSKVSTMNELENQLEKVRNTRLNMASKGIDTQSISREIDNILSKIDTLNRFGMTK